MNLLTTNNFNWSWQVLRLFLSLLAMSLGIRFCASRKGETGWGGWAHLKGANSMAASRLGCRKTLVCTGWAISFLLCITRLRKQSSDLVRPPFPTMKLFSQSEWAVISWAMTIANSFMIIGCGLSHESAEDGCKTVRWSFEHQNPRNMVRLRLRDS